MEQKSCSSRASRGSGDLSVRRFTLNIWVCLNVCENTPSGLMCSVEFWLHLGSTETHRQPRLRSNTHKHAGTHLYSLNIISFHIFFYPHCLLLVLSCRCLRVTHNSRWTKLKRARTHTHGAAGQSAVCLLLPQWSWAPSSPMASFWALWTTLALIFAEAEESATSLHPAEPHIAHKVSQCPQMCRTELCRDVYNVLSWTCGKFPPDEIIKTRLKLCFNLVL